MPVGRIGAWQSAQRVGWGSGVTGPPGVAENPASASWKRPAAQEVTVPFALVWQRQQDARSGLAAGPGLAAAGIAAEVCSIWPKSVAVMEIVPVTRFAGPERTSVISVTVSNRSGAETGVAPGYQKPPVQSPPGSWPVAALG